MQKAVYEAAMDKVRLHEEYMNTKGSSLTPKVFVFLRDHPAALFSEETVDGAPVVRERSFAIADLAVRFFEIGSISAKDLTDSMQSTLGDRVGSKLAEFILN